jgi:hypothetical protein
MKSLTGVLHRIPWWALLAGGVVVFAGLLVMVTPIHLIGLEHAGTNEEERRAIKKEIESTFSEGAIDVARGVVQEMRERTRDPERRKELDDALAQIEGARSQVRDAGAAAADARKDAQEAAAQARKEAQQAAADARKEAQQAAADARKQAEEGAKAAQAAPQPPRRPGDMTVKIHPLGSGAVEIQMNDDDATAGPVAPLPPELRDRIRRNIRSDLYRMGLGGALILIFIPLFILTVVAKFFIDRSRVAQRVAESERREAEYQRMSRQVTEAKLSALQAQVEPHFLYNTLASVQALTEVDPKRANEMTGHLIQYLRNALPKMRESLSTVGQEVELVRAYLNILQMRMGERLAFEISVAPGLESAPFPPLMLPSLVENAIKHGLEPQREGGKVTITAEAADGKTRVIVADTGRGLPEAPGQGVGLANIRERLAALYGGGARLLIEANHPRGVRATLEVPRAAPAAAPKAPPAPPPPPPPPPPKTTTARALAAAGSAERAWRKGLSFAFVGLVALAAVCAGLAIVGILAGELHVDVADGYIEGAPGALIGAVGVAIAFVVIVLALAIVVAIVYGLGFVFAALAIFIPIMVLVSIFPVLAPFVLAGLFVWWLVRRGRRAPRPEPPPPPAAP